VCATHAEPQTLVCGTCSPLIVFCARCSDAHAPSAVGHVIAPLVEAADDMRAYLLRVCATISAWDPCVPPFTLAANGSGGSGGGDVTGGSVPGAPRAPPRAVEE
jgi:hypothetical protein